MPDAGGAWSLRSVQSCVNWPAGTKCPLKCRMQKKSKLALLGSVIAGSALLARAAARARRFYDLRNRIVLITGGSRGLGLIMAREFARRGARIVICSREGVELERARAELSELGADVLAMTADVTVRSDVELLAGTVNEMFGPVDILVNNAGAITAGPFDDMTLTDYGEAMRVHFYGPLCTTMAFLPGMRERGHGRIVNISSIAGKLAVPHMLPYSASKFALAGFSEGVRAAVKRDGVYVTTVCPGLMRTGSARHAEFRGHAESEYAWFAAADAMPGLSIDADRAGSMVVDACVYGDAELVMPLVAQLAAKASALAPGITSDLLSLSERLLPQANGSDAGKRAGADTSRENIPGWLGKRDDGAAGKSNEVKLRVV